jgi:hypothetical protein
VAARAPRWALKPLDARAPRDGPCAAFCVAGESAIRRYDRHMGNDRAKHEITPQQIKVREVTHYQFSWTESAPATEGTFTLQLILDSGSEEYVLRPTADDVDVLQNLFARQGKVFFDMERKVVMFGVTSTSQ